MTTATPTKTAAKKSAKKSPPNMTKESVAMSNAVAKLAEGGAKNDPISGAEVAKAEAKAEKYRLEHAAVSKLLNAFAEQPVTDVEAEIAAMRAAKKPFVNDHRFWSERFSTAGSSYEACATKLRGARRDLWNWLGNVKAVIETYDDATIGPAVRQGIETAIRAKLHGIGMLPKHKSPDYRNLILTAAAFPATPLSDTQKLSLQKQMSVYRTVLREAENEGKHSHEIAAWIESRNGIERIRLKKEDPQEAKDEAKAKADREKAQIEQYVATVRQSKRKFSFTASPADLGWDANKDHYEMVLLATYRQSTGLVEVMQVVKGTAAFDAVARVASKQPFTPAHTAVEATDLFPNGL